MPTTIDIGKLRQSSNDNSTFNYLMQNDTDFADRVKYVQDNNELSPFEKMKFHSVMLDAYEGVNRGSTMDETATMLDNSMKNAEKSASKQLVEDPMSFALETVKNIPSSTANLVGGVASAVASPLQTGKTIFKAGVGGAVNTIESIADLAGVKNAEEIFDLSSEDTAKAIGDFYVQRYGSAESAAKTLRDDPAGFFSDLGAVVSGAGGLLKGGASLVGGVTGASTRTATKLGALGKGLNIAQDIGTQMVKAGYNMEPLVITGKGVVLAGRGVRGVANATMNAVSPSAITTRALKINPSDIQAFKNLPGDELPGEFLLRKGILGGGDLSITPSQGVEFTGSLPMGRTMPGIMRDLERVADKAKSTVDTLLSGVKETYDLVDEVPDAPQIIGEMKKIAERYDLRDPANILNGLLDKGRVTLSDVNQLKRLAYDFFNTYKKSNVANDSFSAQQIIQYERSLRKFIEDQAQIKGLPDIGVLNQDTMKATELLNSMQSAQLSSLSKGKNALSLMDTLTGFGAFGITQDPFATAGIIIARRMAESTLFKTTIAKYLDKLDITKFNILKNAIKSGKHTQESKKILRNVVSKTAEEMKSKLDSDQENIEAFNLRAQKNTQEASMQQVPQPIMQEIQPSQSTLPQETSPVKGVERVMDRMDKKLGMVDEGLNQISTKEVKNMLDEYIQFKNTVNESKPDYLLGKRLAEEVRRLSQKGAFKYLRNGAESLDPEAIGPSIKKAIEHHQGKPIAQELQDFYNSLGSGKYDNISDADGFNNGFRDFISPDGKKSRVDIFQEMIDSGYQGLSKDTIIDNQGHTAQDMIDEWNAKISGATEKRNATRASNKARGTNEAGNGGGSESNIGGGINSTQKISGIPDELQALAQEAKKYKSAEEFIRGQGESLYHGTKKKFDQFQEEIPNFFTKDYENANGYGGYKGKENIIDAIINTDNFLDIYDRSSLNEFIRKNFGRKEIDRVFRPKFKNGKEIRSGQKPDDYYREHIKFFEGRNFAAGEDQKALLDLVKEKGYDGAIIEDIALGGGTDKSYVVLNPSKIKTRSQLTDIWNKVHSPSK